MPKSLPTGTVLLYRHCHMNVLSRDTNLHSPIIHPMASLHHQDPSRPTLAMQASQEAHLCLLFRHNFKAEILNPIHGTVRFLLSHPMSLLILDKVYIRVAIPTVAPLSRHHHLIPHNNTSSNTSNYSIVNLRNRNNSNHLGISSTRLTNLSFLHHKINSINNSDNPRYPNQPHHNRQLTLCPTPLTSLSLHIPLSRALLPQYLRIQKKNIFCTCSQHRWYRNPTR